MKFSKLILCNHGRKCPYCENTMRVPLNRRGAHNTPFFPSRDHVIPKSVMPAQGYLVVCRKCNLEKGNKTLDEWAKHLSDASDPRAGIIRSLMKATPHLKRTVRLPYG